MRSPRVVVGGENTWSFDAATGELAWKADTGAGMKGTDFDSAPAVRGDRVFVVGGKIFSLDFLTGAVAWSHDGGNMRSTPVIAGNVLIVNDSDSYSGEEGRPSRLVALDAVGNGDVHARFGITKRALPGLMDLLAVRWMRSRAGNDGLDCLAFPSPRPVGERALSLGEAKPSLGMEGEGAPAGSICGAAPPHPLSLGSLRSPSSKALSPNGARDAYAIPSTRRAGRGLRPWRAERA